MNGRKVCSRRFTEEGIKIYTPPFNRLASGIAHADDSPRLIVLDKREAKVYTYL